MNVSIHFLEKQIGMALKHVKTYSIITVMSALTLKLLKDSIFSPLRLAETMKFNNTVWGGKAHSRSASGSTH